MTQSPETLIDQLNWRYATKEFDPEKKIPDDVWKKIEESLVLTPSSFGLQPWKFIVVTSPDVKEQLLEHSWGQRQVTDCSHMVVLCAEKTMDEIERNRWLNRMCDVRGIDLDSLSMYASMMDGFFGNMSPEQILSWSKNQVYIALGQLMLGAATLGIDACPMEGIIPAEYDRILNLEDTDFTTSVGCAMGYRADSDKYAELPKVRYENNDVLVRV